MQIFLNSEFPAIDLTESDLLNRVELQHGAKKITFQYKEESSFTSLQPSSTDDINIKAKEWSKNTHVSWLLSRVPMQAQDRPANTRKRASHYLNFWT